MLARGLRLRSPAAATIVCVVVVASAAVFIGRWVGQRIVAHRPFPLSFKVTVADAGGLPLKDARPVAFMFPFTNTTDRPVKIESVIAGCGCVDVAAEPMVVPPQGRGSITAHLQPALGELSKGVRVRVHGRPDPMLLSLKARFSDGVLPQETTSNIGRARQGTAMERVVGLRIEPWCRSRPKRVKSVRGIVHADLVGMNKWDMGLRLRVPKGRTRGMRGAFEDVIRIYGDETGEGEPLLTLGVAGWVEQTVEFFPPQAFLGICTGGAGGMDVEVRGKEPFRVREIQSSDSRVHARVLRQVSPTSAVLRVGVKGEESAIVATSVEVELSNGDIYKLPVVGRLVVNTP
jgi:hypothetical protein